MRNIEKSFFNELTTKMNFFIKEYVDDMGKNKRWIALYELEDFFIGVIVTKEENFNRDFMDSFNYMNLTLNKKCIIYKVIETSKINIEEEETDEYKMIYSSALDKFIYRGSKTEVFKNIISKLEIEKDKKTKFDFKKYSFTYSIIIINILIYLLEIYFSGNIFNIDIYTLVYMGAKYNVLIDEGEIYRLITAGFLHGGIIHLFFNMAALKSIGKDIEITFGKVKYLIIYIFSLLGGSLASYIFSEKSVSVGASGAIFGLLGSTLVFAIKNKNRINKSYIRNIGEVILFNVIIGLSISNIDNYAHFGGLIFGMVISFVMYKEKV